MGQAAAAGLSDQRQSGSTDARSTPVPAVEPEAVGAGAPAPVGGRRASAWPAAFLGVGFLFFGFALGDVAGFSIAQGISQTLLSALFTFVGGVLLSFGGFYVAARSGADVASPGGTVRQVRIDAVRTGVGLACFSLGVTVGINTGVLSRCNVHVQRFFLGEDVARSLSQCVGASAAAIAQHDVPTPGPAAAPALPSASLQSGASATECQEQRNKLDMGLGHCPDAVKLREELQQLAGQCVRP
jgi:hypothetical protein